MERMRDREGIPTYERMPAATGYRSWSLRRGVIALAAAAALAVGACTSSGSGGASPPATTNAGTTAEPAGSAAAGVTLALGTSSVGANVTGENGMSLYIFTPDSATSSACVDQCATTWPPLTVAAASDVSAGAGVTGTIGTITRADGKLQVTLGGHPLYYFANDKTAGDLNGQGLNGKWYAAGADGAGLGITTTPGSSTSSGKGSY